jgi:methionyl-tRNA formyltransferase
VATSQSNIRTFPAQERIPLTITAAEIGRYAELSALVSELEAQQKALRAELLTLHSAGAEQEADCPYLLSFVEQERRTVDWKQQARSLAEKLYGMERADSWKAQVEQSAPIQPITQIRVKPNPAYAAGLRKPAQPVQAIGYGD